MDLLLEVKISMDIYNINNMKKNMRLFMIIFRKDISMFFTLVVYNCRPLLRREPTIVIDSSFGLAFCWIQCC